MSATPLPRQDPKQDSEEVKVIIRCVVKGYQECLFDVNIGEEFEVKSKIGLKGSLDICNENLWPLFGF